MSIAINGIQTWGNLSQANPGMSLQDLKAKGQNDGQDQIYFSHNGQNYYVEGDDMDFSGLQKTAVGTLPKLSFVKDGETHVVELRKENIDDEKSKVSDFTLSNPISIAGGVVVGGAAISQVPRVLNNVISSFPLMGNGALMPTPKSASIAAAIGVGLIAVGAYHAYATRNQESGLKGQGTEIQAAPEKSAFKKTWDALDKFSVLP